MTGEPNRDPSDTKEFLRISSHSVRKLRSEKGVSKYSRIKLKKLQLKIRDLKSSTLKSQDKQDLMFEISNEILSSENSGDLIESEYVNYLSGVVSGYKERFATSFPPEDANMLILSEYRSTFDIIKKLGSGESCQRWKVYNKGSKQESLLTIYNLDEGFFPERFYGSSAAWRTLDHKNILRLREAYAHKKSYGIETEFVEQDALSVSGTGSPLKLEEALFAAYQIAEGLEYAHGKNIHHLVLSPENIYVANMGTLKIAGWNQAAMLRIGESMQINSKKSMLRYAAPEVINPGIGKPSQFSDIFSLSLLTMNLLLGGTLETLPEPQENTLHNESHAKLVSALEKLERLDQDILGLLKRGISPIPGERGNASQFKEAIGKHLRFTVKGEDKGANLDATEYRHSMASKNSPPDPEETETQKEKVTRIEISLVGAPPVSSAGTRNPNREEDSLRSVAAELEGLIEKERYDAILQTLKNRESTILSVYPNLKDSIDVMKSNLSAVVKFPMVPRNEVNTRIHDLITTLEG